MKWLFRCGICMAVALVLFMVPGRLEGPVLVAISPGLGLSLVDVLALVPLDHLVDAGHFTWEDGAHQHPEIVTGWWTGGQARA
jgi:hypothetical protein